jgi:hypothetical protein
MRLQIARGGTELLVQALRARAGGRRPLAAAG